MKLQIDAKNSRGDDVEGTLNVFSNLSGNVVFCIDGPQVPIERLEIPAKYVRVALVMFEEAVATMKGYKNGS